MNFAEIVMQYAPMWAPVLTAVFGILALVLKGLVDVDKTVDKLKDNKVIAELKEQLKTQICENRRIKEELEELRLEMVNINAYAHEIKSAEDLITSIQRSDVEVNKELLQKVNLLINALYGGKSLERINEEEKA